MKNIQRAVRALVRRISKLVAQTHILLIFAIASNAYAFKIDFTVFSGDPVHESISKESLKLVSQIVPQSEKKIEFSEEAVKWIQEANTENDERHFDDPTFHFDAETFQESIENLVTWRHQIVDLVKQGHVKESNYGTGSESGLGAWDVLGRSLHLIQDFFAHSNWVELNSRQVVDQKLPNFGDDDPFKGSDLEGLAYGDAAKAVPACDKSGLVTGSPLTSGHYLPAMSGLKASLYDDFVFSAEIPGDIESQEALKNGYTSILIPKTINQTQRNKLGAYTKEWSEIYYPSNFTKLPDRCIHGGDGAGPGLNKDDSKRGGDNFVKARKLAEIASKKYVDVIISDILQAGGSDAGPLVCAFLGHEPTSDCHFDQKCAIVSRVAWNESPILVGKSVSFRISGENLPLTTTLKMSNSRWERCSTAEWLIMKRELTITCVPTAPGLTGVDVVAGVGWPKIGETTQVSVSGASISINSGLPLQIWDSVSFAFSSTYEKISSAVWTIVDSTGRVVSTLIGNVGQAVSYVFTSPGSYGVEVEYKDSLSVAVDSDVTQIRVENVAVNEITPSTAQTGVLTSFKVSGVNLPVDLVFSIEGCENVTPILVGGSTTQRQFSCTFPEGTPSGIKEGTIAAAGSNGQPFGHAFKSFAVTVSGASNTPDGGTGATSGDDTLEAAFTTKSTPNAPWSFGWQGSSGALVPFAGFQPAGSRSDYPTLAIWNKASGSAGSPPTDVYPWVVKNTGAIPVQYAADVTPFPAQSVIVTPGSAGERAIFRWTAPAAGTYEVNAKYELMQGGAVDVHVQQNGTDIFGANIAGLGSQAAAPTKTVTLNAGDRIDFAVGDGGNTQDSDITRVYASVKAGTVTPALTVLAKNFVSSISIATNVEPGNTCRNGLVYNAPPYVETANSGEWTVSVPSAGDYVMEVDYAALESRPLDIKINGAMAFSGVLGDVTGGWCVSNVKTVALGRVSLTPGMNRFSLQRSGAFPHLQAFRFKPFVVPSTATVNPANGHAYEIIVCGTWMQCRVAAHSRGGELVTIRSKAENDWIQSNIFPLSRHDTLWIGLEKANGSWTWSSRESLSFVNWLPGEPNNTSGNDNCGQSGKGAVYEGRWNDNVCSISSVSEAVIEYSGASVVNSSIRANWCGQSLGFIGNTLPANWSSGLIRGGPGLRNDRMEAAPVDSGTYIFAADSPVGQGVKTIVVEFDNNRTASYWGQFNQIQLKNSTGRFWFFGDGHFQYRSGSREFTSFETDRSVYVDGGSSRFLQQMSDGSIGLGQFKTKLIFRDGSVQWVITDSTGKSTTTSMTLAPEFRVSDIVSPYIAVYTTTDGAAWIDNVTTQCLPN